MNKIYFAHPLNIYGQPIESAFEKLIADKLTWGNVGMIENPNQPHHQVGYNNYAQRRKESGLNHKGMSYFYDEVLPQCDGCAGVPFLDGRLGLGVAGEMKWFIEKELPVWIIVPCYNSITLDELVRFIQSPLNGYFNLKPVTFQEVKDILEFSPGLVIPHEETRLRTWKVYNKERRPYEKAHLVKMPIPEGFYPNN